MRERHFAGTNSKPRKAPENAQTPTSRVHALLGALTERRPTDSKENTKPILTKFYSEPNLSQEAKRFQPIRTLTEETLDEVKKQLCEGRKLNRKFWMK